MEGIIKMHTTIEAADLLGVTPGRIRQMVIAGEIEAQKHGRDLFIPQSEIEKAKGRKTAPGPTPKTEKKGARKR